MEFADARWVAERAQTDATGFRHSRHGWHEFQSTYPTPIYETGADLAIQSPPSRAGERRRDIAILSTPNSTPAMPGLMIHRWEWFGPDQPATSANCSEYSMDTIRRFSRVVEPGLAGQSLGRGIVVDFSRYTCGVSRRLIWVEVACSSWRRPGRLESVNWVSEICYLVRARPPQRTPRLVASRVRWTRPAIIFLATMATGDLRRIPPSRIAQWRSRRTVSHESSLGRCSRKPRGRPAGPTGGTVVVDRVPPCCSAPMAAATLRGAVAIVSKKYWTASVDLTTHGRCRGCAGHLTEATLRTRQHIPLSRKSAGTVHLRSVGTDCEGGGRYPTRENLAACDLMDRPLARDRPRNGTGYTRRSCPRRRSSRRRLKWRERISGSQQPGSMHLLPAIAVIAANRSCVPVLTSRPRTQPAVAFGPSRNPRLYRLKAICGHCPLWTTSRSLRVGLPEFLVESRISLKQNQIPATLFAHALHGQVDLRPFLDLANTDDQLRLAQLSEALYTKVLELAAASLAATHLASVAPPGLRAVGTSSGFSGRDQARFDPPMGS